MIALTFADGILLYLVLWLLMLGVLWLREQSRLKQNLLRLNRSRLFTCDNCLHSFLSEEPVNVARCPRCNNVCFRRKSRNRE